MSQCHSFHDCPLRSSSLLIINKEKQTIVTATDEVFDILGYEPTQLVGKSVKILDPRQQCYINEEGKKIERFTLLHESFGSIPFEICIHHDPLTNATDLDYWLIQPALSHSKKTSLPATILRLSPFGTIEHAYPSTQFPQQTHQLRGHPIMSFVHESDVRPLCEKLCNIRKRFYHTFRIRWLKIFQPKEEYTEEDYEWVSFTVMNSPRRLSYDSVNDPQSRPICIIRSEQQIQPQPCLSYFSTPYLLTGLVTGTIKLIWEGTSLGVNQFFEIMEAMHSALDQGKTYIIEFLIHILTHALKMVNEIIYFSSLEEYKSMEDNNNENTMIHMNNNKKLCNNRKANKYNNKIIIEEKKKKYRLYGLSSVKVSVNNSIWSVPLYIKKTIQSSPYLTDDFRKENNEKLNSN